MMVDPADAFNSPSVMPSVTWAAVADGLEAVKNRG